MRRGGERDGKGWSGGVKDHWGGGRERRGKECEDCKVDWDADWLNS